MSNIREIAREKAAFCRESILKYQCMKKPCLIMFAVYMVGMFAILKSDFNYRDDLRRIMSGKQGWGSSYGRYLSDFLSNFIHIDSYMMDVSPLPQMIAGAMLAVSAIILWYLISDKKKFSVWDVAALLPLGLSPYFLACLSYKFDAPYMALSILGSVMPLLFAKKGHLVYGATAFMGSLVMCMTYQAASGVFPIIVILICVNRWNEKEELKQIFKFIGTSVAGYLAGLLVYKLFLMPTRKTYVSNELPSINQIIPTTISNLQKYFGHIAEDFKLEWLILIFFLCIGFVFVMVRDSKQKKPIAFLISCVALGLMLVLAFGIYPVLEDPLYHPRAMYGFGVLLASLGISVSVARKGYPAKMVCLVLSWCFFVFSFTYGNALTIQGDYIEFRSREILDDLKDLDIMMSKQQVIIQVDGSIGNAPAIRRMPDDYKILKRLIPTVYKDGNWGLNMFRYYGLNMKKADWNRPATEDFKNYNLPVLKETMFHKISGNEKYVLIEMK